MSDAKRHTLALAIEIEAALDQLLKSTPVTDRIRRERIAHLIGLARHVRDSMDAHWPPAVPPGVVRAPDSLRNPKA